MRSDWQDLLYLYQQIVTASLLHYLQRQAGWKVRRGIYSARVVLWLMMVQRLHGGATLASAVQLLIQGAAGDLLENCRRVRRGQISPRTGGYCQARRKLPKLLCRQVSEQIVEQLRQVLNRDAAEQRNVFLLDGSSLELEHSPDIVDTYPPAPNQNGQSHWPVLRIVVAHDVDTGLAQTPHWGPMFGTAAVSEQELAEAVMAQLPGDATVLGDRNFGVFSIAHAAQQRGLKMLLPLTDGRARKLAGSFSAPAEREVVWTASRWDGGKRQKFADGSPVRGRVIAARLGRGQSQQWLFLFTTLALPAEQIVALYGRRWNIETDLRSLKRTVRLHHLSAKTTDMLDKELLLAISAYNFVRAVMCMAARRSRIPPRQLSFAGVLNVVNCAWSKLIAAPNKRTHDQEFFRVLDLAAQCTLPKRPKRHAYPRLIWRRPSSFPCRKAEKTK